MEYRKVGIFGKEHDDVKKLYLSAFPKIERVPFLPLIFVSSCIPKHFSLNAVYEDNEFIAMVYYIYSKEWAMLMFFAVDDAHRGYGIGEKIIEDIKKKFECVTVIMESMFVTCDNKEQREKRFAFYKKCGLFDTGYTYIDNAREKYDILANQKCFLDGAFRFSEFEEMSWYYRVIEKKSEFIKR